MKFDKDTYDEILNGEDTYKTIAKYLYGGIDYLHGNTDSVERDESQSILIGWTDGEYDHRDILFTYRVQHTDNHQRGMRWCHFFVGIVDFVCYGFTIEINTDNRKGPGYLKEKLRLHDNHCDDAICELVDGVIHELDILEGNVLPEEQSQDKSND